MAINAGNLVLHQALHGYSDGHRLLACFRALPRDAQRIMLALSDAAGSGSPEGFDSYLTAYPLRSAEMFALARTWSAPEMPRPGCVWTHTLILDVGDLALLESAGALAPLFRRPSASVDGYDTPLSAKPGPGPLLDEDSRAIAPRVIEALYEGSPSGPVVVAAQRSDDVETLFLALWDQQWDEQRASFTLSTGSIAPRLLDGVPFRLQASPAAEARRMWRKAKAPVVEFSSTQKVSDEMARWAREAADALGGQPSPLRRFVHDIGRRLPADAAYFRPLVSAYIDCNRHQGPKLVRSLIESAAGAFPEADQGIALKVALFGVPQDAYASRIPATEEDVVPALAASDHAEAFPPEPLQIEPRAAGWWAECRDYAAVARIADRPVASLREAFLTGVARALSVADIHRFLADYRPADAALVVRQSGFASRPDHWTCPPEVQVRMAEIVREAHGTLQMELSPVIRASLAAHADSAAPILGEAAGDQALLAVMAWLGQTGDIDGVGPKWRAALGARPGQLMGWLSSEENPGPWSLWLAATILDPEASVVREAGVGPWLRHLPLGDRLPAPNRHQLHAFVLGVGLLDATDSTFPAIPATFANVYRAAQADELDDQAWSHVGHQLPAARWWREWDRCERLRRGIVERFLGLHWSACLLLGLAQDAEVFADIVREFRESREGRSYLRSVVRSIEDGTIPAPPDRLQSIT